MLLTPDQMTAYRQILDTLTADGITQIESLLSAVADSDEEVVREAVMATLPSIGGAAVAAAQGTSAIFFEEAAALQGINATAHVPDTLDDKAWHALGGYALWQPNGFSTEAALSRIGGGLTRHVSRASSDVITLSAAGHGMRVQRVPSVGACAFCIMLGSRGAIYSYKGEITAGGMPAVEAEQGYHDFCRCSIMPLTDGNRMKLKALEDGHYETYREAYDKVRSGQRLESVTTKAGDGSLKTTTRWVDSGGVRSAKDTTSDILAYMRAQTGAR